MIYCAIYTTPEDELEYVSLSIEALVQDVQVGPEEIQANSRLYEDRVKIIAFYAPDGVPSGTLKDDPFGEGAK